MDLSKATEVFNQGGIIAYPTEAVFGLGCDPDNEQAIKKLLSLKCRSADKGLIVLASNYAQLLPFVDDNAISQDMRSTVLSRWPSEITQLLPKNNHISPLLCGAFTTIAVRITKHPDVIALCNNIGKAIVSTSANITGQLPAKTWQQVLAYFPHQLDYIIKTNTLGLAKPSTIINALTGEIIRS